MSIRSSSCTALALMFLAAGGAFAGPVRKAQQPVAGEYIVVLKDTGASRLTPDASMPSVADAQASAYGFRRDRVFRHALRGYSARMTEAQAQRLANDPRVAFVEENGYVHTTDTQTGATWGLDRIDQFALPLNGTYTYYLTGAGAHAYVIDTGIRASHTEFAGRIGNAFTAVNDGYGINDCNGHGTHVAGTIGGTTYGVAKWVTLHPVRVIDCAGNGTTASVVAGVDWVRTNAVQPAVANMSLGGGGSAAIDAAVGNAITAGITFVVSAGNNNYNACLYSPARLTTAITVGATTSTDYRASYSNWGSCVDLFAPGSSITSAGIASDTATAVYSGTSMAAPHVTGVIALYLGQRGPQAPGAVATALLGNATLQMITDPGVGSPNRLLYSVIGLLPTPTPTTVPTPTATPVPGSAPPPPTGLFSNQTSPCSWRATWDASPGATYYNFRDMSGNHTLTVTATQVDYSVTSCYDQFPTDEKPKWVQACGTGGCSVKSYFP